MENFFLFNEMNREVENTIAKTKKKDPRILNATAEAILEKEFFGACGMMEEK